MCSSLISSSSRWQFLKVSRTDLDSPPAAGHEFAPWQHAMLYSLPAAARVLLCALGDATARRRVGARAQRAFHGTYPDSRGPSRPCRAPPRLRSSYCTTPPLYADGAGGRTVHIATRRVLADPFSHLVSWYAPLAGRGGCRPRLTSKLRRKLTLELAGEDNPQSDGGGTRSTAHARSAAACSASKVATHTSWAA